MRRLRKVETCEWTLFFTVFAFCCVVIVVVYDYNPRDFSFKIALLMSIITSFIFGYFPGKYTEIPPISKSKK